MSRAVPKFCPSCGGALELRIPDIGRFYDRVRTGRFDFYQRFDDALRIISGDSRIEYLWRR